MEALLRHTEGALAAQQDKGRQLGERLAAMERASRLSVSAAPGRCLMLACCEGRGMGS